MKSYPAKSISNIKLDNSISELPVLCLYQVRIHNFLEKTKNHQRKKTMHDVQESMEKEKEMLRKRVNSLIRRKRLMEVQNLVIQDETKPWNRDKQAKVCSPHHFFQKGELGPFLYLVFITFWIEVFSFCFWFRLNFFLSCPFPRLVSNAQYNFAAWKSSNRIIN
jgi:hypothetical protein